MTPADVVDAKPGPGQSRLAAALFSPSTSHRYLGGGQRMSKPEEESDSEREAERPTVHPVAAADAAVARITSRLTILFYRRFTKIITDLAGGDLIGAIVLQTIMAGNAGSFDEHPNTAGQYASLEDIPPDSVRRPVSILAVAGSLGMPYETTRRHVNRLVKEGRCVKVKGGVIFPRQGSEARQATPPS